MVSRLMSDGPTGDRVIDRVYSVARLKIARSLNGDPGVYDTTERDPRSATSKRFLQLMSVRRLCQIQFATIKHRFQRLNETHR